MDKTNQMDCDIIKLRRTLGKSKNNKKEQEIVVEVKTKPRRHGKCYSVESVKVSTPKSNIKNQIKSYTVYQLDIWEHVSQYIQPEDILTFALLSYDTNFIVSTSQFWKSQYERHCKTSDMYRLPEYLQEQNIFKGDKKCIRHRVIRALYYCYKPFKERLTRSYSINLINHRRYLFSSSENVGSYWILCLKFINFITLNQRLLAEKAIFETTDEVVNDWESLIENDELITKNSQKMTVLENPDEGVCLFYIISTRRLTHLSQFYLDEAAFHSRLIQVKKQKNADQKINLQIGLENIYSRNVITIEMNNIEKIEIIPWWHPDFKKYLKP